MGDVIQFLYGEDGMDGAAIESQKIEALKATEVGQRTGSKGQAVDTTNDPPVLAGQHWPPRRRRHHLIGSPPDSC